MSLAGRLRREMSAMGETARVIARVALGPGATEGRAPQDRLDGAVVLGCPTRANGALSRSQVERVVTAALLWDRGLVGGFIVSGAAVRTPYEEASSMAAALHAMGVPAEVIHLERQARHTDENIWNALQVARALGWNTVGIVSQPRHGLMAAAMMQAWSGMGAAIATEPRAVAIHHAASGAPLWSLTGRRQADWTSPGRASLRDRSTLRYLRLAWRHAHGDATRPFTTPPASVPTLAELRRQGRPS